MNVFYLTLGLCVGALMAGLADGQANSTTAKPRAPTGSLTTVSPLSSSANASSNSTSGCFKSLDDWKLDLGQRIKGTDGALKKELDATVGMFSWFRRMGLRVSRSNVANVQRQLDATWRRRNVTPKAKGQAVVRAEAVLDSLGRAMLARQWNRSPQCCFGPTIKARCSRLQTKK
ncbi:hypothetical protein HDE_05055 [Halotydeus destructor]|nr:hypothetical protein HDE_05055 [Halotydeus destructor]